MENISDLKKELIKKINSSNQVFLMPHEYIDLDALASCIGMSLIVKNLNKPVYIIFNDELDKIDNSANRVICEYNTSVSFIDLEVYNKIKSDNDLLITLDVNKENLVYDKDMLKDFKNIFIIDHHNEDAKTIKTNLKYIDTSSSSATEIVANLLKVFNIKYDKRIATYLLAGIYLDTGKFQNIRNYKTPIVIAKLIKSGASEEEVKKYFVMDYESDRKVHNLISKAKFITKDIALAVADDNTTYTRADLAKVAEYLLMFKLVAAFAAGFIDDGLISISARSTGELDVCSLMEQMCGGGTNYSAATMIKSNDIDNNIQKLKLLINKEISN